LEQRVAERTARLEEAVKELESFSYSVSHDLRAPLRSLDGFSSVLLEDYSDKLDEQGTHYLDRIKNASQKMATLIDDLLELSRVTRREMSIKRVDLTKICKKIAKEFNTREPKQKIKFSIKKGLKDNGDPILIEQALRNLMDNSWKFTSQKTKAKVEIGSKTENNEEIFFIKDNGIGFDMKYSDKLFVPFQRLHSKPEFPGTGIGLATVQRIINRHGGKIWGEGKPDKGAIFFFKFAQTYNNKSEEVSNES
jgi:light-regulated signal transduction histidine kinase (bacteriophytochrome)